MLGLRWRVLRDGKPPETAHFEGDEDPRTRFPVAYDGNRLVGCATLQVDPRGGAGYRIRGMAVDALYRNRGIGSRLVQMIQKTATEESFGIWCNARVRAAPLYLRRG